MTFRVRNLIRIQRVVDFPQGTLIECVVPGWNPHRVVYLPVDRLPDGLLETIETSPGPNECTIYVHAQLNLAAETGADLDPSGPWELSKVRADIPDHVLTFHDESATAPGDVHRTNQVI